LFFLSAPVLIRYLWQVKTVVTLHWCLIRALPLSPATITTELLESETAIKIKITNTSLK